MVLTHNSFMVPCMGVHKLVVASIEESAGKGLHIMVRMEFHRLEPEVGIGEERAAHKQEATAVVGDT